MKEKPKKQYMRWIALENSGVAHELPGSVAWGTFDRAWQYVDRKWSGRAKTVRALGIL